MQYINPFLRKEGEKGKNFVIVKSDKPKQFIIKIYSPHGIVNS